ncbi:hypothetical protein KSS87_010586, partial [Heliosperma pusillum]
MVEQGESSKWKGKGKKRPYDGTNDDPNKKPKSACWICGKVGHFKADCRVRKKKLAGKGNGKGSKDHGASTSKDDEIIWWIDSGATRHVCKTRSWFKDYVPVKDGSILHMGNESTAKIQGCGNIT